MKIKEVCQRTGLTKKAIRYYEDEGLFFPERTTINFREYRDYTETDLEALEQITALRSLSLSIEEIRTMREDPEAAPEIFRKRQEQLQASAEETARQLRFYQSLDYDRRPFLDYVYTRLEEDALWEAPRPREKTAAPAFLVLLPGMAALVVPLARQLLLPGLSLVLPWRIHAFWVVYILSHLLAGAAIAYVALHGEDFRRSQAAKLSALAWVVLLLLAAGGYLYGYLWGADILLLDYMSMETLYAVLGGYLVLCFYLWKGESLS